MWFPSGVESDADSIDALKLENAKLRTQVESLKAIAEQNTNLMWSMQSYQYQVDMTRQQYDKRLKEKDIRGTELQLKRMLFLPTDPRHFFVDWERGGIFKQ